MLVLHLEVGFLGVLDNLVDSVDFKLIRMHLRLVVFELKHHLFELFGPLLKVLLINYQLFCDFWAALLGKDVLQFDVQFLLLLDEYVFLGDFFGLGDQPFLQTLDLLDEFVGLDVC